MSVDFSNNHFELFDLPVGFEIDEVKLTERFQTLQRALHPDQFAAATGAEKRWSMQASSLVNGAYQSLSDPLTRATYLLELNGISVDEETDTQMDPMFLMQQMELRESIGDAEDATDPFDALDKVRKELRSGTLDCTERFRSAAKEAAIAATNATTSASHWATARTVVREWQFYKKLGREVKDIEARLDD